MTRLIRLAIVGIVLSTGVAYAQTNTTRDTTTDVRENRDFDLGWMGLIGLVGLAGLMPRKESRNAYRETTASAR